MTRWATRPPTAGKACFSPTISLTCWVIPFENCTFTPQLPEGCDLKEERILLHCCCAPCSTAIIEWMVSQGLRPAVFFSNSNIIPFEEY
ncbi:MAG: epoxyqueuosine reductase QueH, partial [Bacteroidales bacterium]|nr:epoxyqueuosine reductase QueH [Bacteroidales bacterium]